VKGVTHGLVFIIFRKNSPESQKTEKRTSCERAERGEGVKVKGLKEEWVLRVTLEMQEPRDIKALLQGIGFAGGNSGRREPRLDHVGT